MNYMRKIVNWLIIIATTLLPLKFGKLVGMPEIPAYYPQSWPLWLIVAWPPVSFPMFSGALLLLALAVFPARAREFSGVFLLPENLAE